MSGLSVQNLSKSYGGRDIFTDLSFDVPGGSRLAVVGPNGCGKSTLIKILAGESEADTGNIKTYGEGGIGYAAQELTEADLEQGILAWVMSVFPSWSEFWVKWERAVAEGDETAIMQLGKEQARLEQVFGYNPEHRAETVLTGLGFATDEMHKPLRQFSGGWRERAKLARILVQGTGVLLLDEPTNHLDLEAVEWLEEYLLNFKGALIFVAHDRVFMDNVATHVLFLGNSRPAMRRGNFSQYLAWQEENEENRARQAAKLEARISHQMDYVNRFRVKARKAAQAQSKLKQVEKMKSELEGLTPEQRRRTLSFTLPEPERAEKVVAGVSDLEFSFGGKKRLWPTLGFQIYRGQKIALVAPNGVGKSTLLKLLVGEHKPDSGIVHIGSKTRLGYYSQHQTEILSTTNTVVGELRRLSDPRTTEEELRSVLGLFMLGEEFFDRPVGRLSGGEKARLVLSSLFLARCNFLVMDEPTNHLDLESREALVSALKDFEGTLFMVAHDRYLLTEVAEEAWALGTDGITVYLGGFDEYERKRKEALAEKPKDSGAPRIKRRMDKEEKRRVAEMRNELYRRLKPLKDRYGKLEGELEQVAERQAELETVMAAPETYADKEKFMALNKEYQQLKEREEDLFLEMGGLEEEINNLETERERLAS